MASNAILIVSTLFTMVVVVPLTLVNSMPMIEDSLVLRATDSPTEHGSSRLESYHLEADDTESSPIPMIIDEGQSLIGSKNFYTSFKSDIEQSDKTVISDEERNSDDLETAAGTNILRPLFVYRQQLAYRERIRKAGRRAAPNF